MICDLIFYSLKILIKAKTQINDLQPGGNKNTTHVSNLFSLDLGLIQKFINF